MFLAITRQVPQRSTVEFAATVSRPWPNSCRTQTITSAICQSAHASIGTALVRSPYVCPATVIGPVRPFKTTLISRALSPLLTQSLPTPGVYRPQTDLCLPADGRQGVSADAHAGRRSLTLADSQSMLSPNAVARLGAEANRVAQKQIAR
ncbi:MAG: hypothetical protein ACI9DF_002163 [Verrucomicrobiales bacterium]|jgi:hypothetical protein